MYKQVTATIEHNGDRYESAIQFIQHFLKDLLCGKKVGEAANVKFISVYDRDKFIKTLNTGTVWTPIITGSWQKNNGLYLYHIAETPSTMIEAQLKSELEIQFKRVRPSSVISSMNKESIISNEFTNDSFKLRRFKVYKNKATKVMSKYTDNVSEKFDVLWQIRSEA